MRLACSLDRLALGATAFFWGACVVGAAIVLVAGAPLGILATVLAVAIFAAPAWVMLTAPRGYVVGPAALGIERRIGTIEVPLGAINKVREVALPEFGRLLRTFGSGGAHGYFGSFRSEHLGALSFQATRRDRHVLVTRNDGARSLVLSPDEPGAFVAALRDALAAHQRSTPA